MNNYNNFKQRLNRNDNVLSDDNIAVYGGELDDYVSLINFVVFTTLQDILIVCF